MTLVAFFDLELHEMDVITSFLNGDIEKKFIWCIHKTLCREIDECLKHSYYTHVCFMFLVDFTFK